MRWTEVISEQTKKQKQDKYKRHKRGIKDIKMNRQRDGQRRLSVSFSFFKR